MAQTENMRVTEQLARSVAILLAIGIITCTTPAGTAPSPGSPSASSDSPAPSDAAAVRRFDACLVTLPASWEKAFAGGTTFPEGMSFGLSNPSVVGSVVYGQYNTADSSGIARLDLVTGSVEKLVNFGPDVSGTNAIAVALPWLSWTQGNSTQNIFDWTMYAKNLQTGEILILARSRQPNGSFLPGQQPTQVFKGTTLAWSQALPGPLTTYSTELHIFDLGTRREKILASGRVSAPVYAGNLLIWGERDAAGVYSFKTVDSTTLAPMPVPAALRDPLSIIYLTGSRDWFAWSVEGLQEANVWRVGTAERRTYRTTDIKHYFQFMQFAGGYLLWYSGVGSAILDLDGGAIVDVGGPLAAGDDLIVVSQPTGPHVKGEFVASRVSAARASTLSPLGGCIR
jgi:hypothetical protein